MGAVATIYFGWRRHVREERLAREAAKPSLLIRPDYPNGDHRPRFHYSAGLENEDKVVTIRAVRLEARMDGESVGTTAGPFNLRPSEVAFAGVSIDFEGTAQELRKRVNFRAWDDTGHEWSWEP
jgi:hypothetical protein